MKIVLNRAYGGFSLSPAGIFKYFKFLQKPVYFYCQFKYKRRDMYNEWRLVPYKNLSPDQSYLVTNADYGASFREIPKDFQYVRLDNIDRTSDALVKTVEHLKSKSYGKHSYLEVFDIPEIAKDSYYIDDRDGIETVHEKHKYWPANEYSRK